MKINNQEVGVAISRNAPRIHKGGASCWTVSGTRRATATEARASKTAEPGQNAQPIAIHLRNHHVRGVHGHTFSSAEARSLTHKRAVHKVLLHSVIVGQEHAAIIGQRQALARRHAAHAGANQRSPWRFHQAVGGAYEDVAVWESSDALGTVY